MTFFDEPSYTFLSSTNDLFTMSENERERDRDIRDVSLFSDFVMSRFIHRIPFFGYIYLWEACGEVMKKDLEEGGETFVEK